MNITRDVAVKCPVCEGKGKAGKRQACKSCDGRGFLWGKEVTSGEPIFPVMIPIVQPTQTPLFEPWPGYPSTYITW